MTERRICFVVFRYSHHSPHSGYSRLAEFGAKEYGADIIRVSKPLSRRIIRERMLWRLADGTPGYDRTSMAAELQVVKDILRRRDSIYHFLYGETTYHYTGYLDNFRGNRLVATFHQPPQGIRRAVQIDWHLRKLSAIVCVGRNQQDYFSDAVGLDNTFFVPLGVDTQYFTPSISVAERDPDLCLFVGSNYRDFPSLRGVIELVAYRRPQTRFIAITSPENARLIGRHPSLAVLSRVPEEKLRELYRTAALMIMPMTDATANNALLESMACGLPLVATDIGAIRDYIGADGTRLVAPQDARGMAEVVLELLEDTRCREKMGQAARARALEFAWPKVVKELATVYGAVG